MICLWDRGKFFRLRRFGVLEGNVFFLIGILLDCNTRWVECKYLGFVDLSSCLQGEQSNDEKKDVTKFLVPMLNTLFYSR